MDRISGVRRKIERAIHHIKQLDVEVRTYCDSDPKPYTIIAKEKPEIFHTLLSVGKVRQPPPVISLIVGDIVHNLRSSLDHLVCRLVERAGGKVENWTAFPISESPEKYASAKQRGVIEGVIDGAEKLIDECQRYVTMDDTLWHIHELDRIDKHRLLVTSAIATTAYGFDIDRIIPGLTIWFPRGRHFPLIEGQEIVNIPTSTYTKEKDNFKLELDVTFGNSEIVAGKPILETLQQMADFVDCFVGKFERFLV